VQGFLGKVPYLSLVVRLDQRCTIELLRYHTRWLSPTAISSQEAQWIFALFLRVDKLMTSDQMSVLRDLCRKCAVIRSGVTDPEDPQLASLNMFITVVVQFFGQSDLG